jgi:hypothetical protein
MILRTTPALWAISRRHIVGVSTSSTFFISLYSIPSGLGLPLWLFRGVHQDATITQSNNLPDIAVKGGDLILVDFRQARMDVCTVFALEYMTKFTYKSPHHKATEFPDPEKVIWDRQSTLIQGIGLHKCPGFRFVDEVSTFTTNLLELISNSN